MEYDLELRTNEFSKSLLRFVRKIKISVTNENIVKQVLRSATSVGANYCEANGAVSKTDFRAKIFICKKEAKETLYWVELLKELIDSDNINELVRIESEAKQLMLIFSKIGTSLSN